MPVQFDVYLKAMFSLLVTCVLTMVVCIRWSSSSNGSLKAVSADGNTSIGAVDFLESWNILRENFVREFSDLLEENVEETDPRLLKLIRKYLFPPGTHSVEKLSFYMPATIQEQMAMMYFDTKKSGFFVESGSLDGERSSNTIGLERLGWQGLLIEADPYFFFQSLGKNRKTWKLNAALAHSNKSGMVNFAESARGGGVLNPSGSMSIPAFPLNTIMQAMGRSTIEFLSLDVEGLESLILKTQPYDKLHICALTMEYNHDPEEPQEIIQMMEEKGFRFIEKIDFEDVKISHYTHDLFFINKNGCNM